VRTTNFYKTPPSQCCREVICICIEISCNWKFSDFRQKRNIGSSSKSGSSPHKPTHLCSMHFNTHALPDHYAIVTCFLPCSEGHHRRLDSELITDIFIIVMHNYLSLSLAHTYTIKRAVDIKNQIKHQITGAVCVFLFFGIMPNALDQCLLITIIDMHFACCLMNPSTGMSWNIGY